MAASAFDDKTKEPSTQDLDEVLSDSAAFLKEIEEYVVAQCGEVSADWKYYGKQAGWTVAYAHGDRRVFHLIPQVGFFSIVFVLGKAAVAAALESALPDPMKANIEAARQYVEGRSVRLDVRTAADVDIARQLVSIKLMPPLR